MNPGRLKEKFNEVFEGGREPEIYSAPGRVNLIGEHTDYNDGLVLPIAIDLATFGLFRPTSEKMIRIYSENLDSSAEIELKEIPRQRGDWTDYVSGVLAGLEKKGGTISGLEIYLSSEIPVGSGLSSSAALEVVTATGAIGALDLAKFDDIELIKLCQTAENEFVGANTGIMDPYASYLGQEGRALLIDTAVPSHRAVELKLEGYELLVIDTTVSHTHGDNEYNRRRSECEAALKEINSQPREGTFQTISEIRPDQLNDILPGIEKTLANRVEHVVRENERVEEVADLFERGKPGEAGDLFFASHSSLRELYEVSSPELDFLVEFAKSEGIPGARMTGGGFGGSTIHLVPEEQVDIYLEKASREFEKEFGITPGGFPVSPSDGAKFHDPSFRG